MSSSSGSTTSIDEAKRAAARAAIAELPQGGVIGLGTGSTAKLFIDVVGELVAAGRKYIGVPTSDASRAQATALGIPLLPDDGPWDIAVAVDGADEVSPALDMIKGGGGAQTREKIVNYSAKKNVIVVDGTKLSSHLGDKWHVPLEVLAFAHKATARHLERHGTPVLRMTADKTAPRRTDAGNFIYDLACGPIADPPALDLALHAIPGVVETGLFIQRADVVIVARESGIEKLVRR